MRTTRREFLCRLSVGAAALATGGALAGCGGGGGGSASSGGFHPNLTLFMPNYGNLVTLDHWSALPLTVFFANDLTITPQGGSLTHVNDVIRAGFDLWGAASGGILGYRVVSDAGSADIVVSAQLIPQPAGTTETGDTSYSAPNNLITSATTVVYVWPEMTAAELTVGQQTTSAHEFGHLLGIAGHSNDPSDLMYATHDPTQAVAPSARDINTAKTIYASLFS